MAKPVAVSQEVVEEVAISSYWNCCQGSSDKDFSIRLEQAEAGWAVNTASGPRNGAMTPCCKSGAAPVPYLKALGIYNKEYAKRISKSYQRVDVETEGFVQPPTDKAHSGLAPQLLVPITLEKAELLLDDPEWGAQEKHDGDRLMLHRAEEGGEIQGVNRKGYVTGFARELVTALAGHPETFLMDGEGFSNNIQAFDLLQDGSKDLRSLPFEERYRALEIFAKDLQPAVFVVPLARTTAEKRALLDRLIAEEREGIVFKRLSSPYSGGRPSKSKSKKLDIRGDQFKYKLYETASCLVESINEQRSVVVVLFDENGTKVNVGSITILSNFDVPQIGSVIEVRYLYAFKGGSLYQTTYLGERTDVGPEECLMEQLKYKS